MRCNMGFSSGLATKDPTCTLTNISLGCHHRLLSQHSIFPNTATFTYVRSFVWTGHRNMAGLLAMIADRMDENSLTPEMLPSPPGPGV